MVAYAWRWLVDRFGLGPIWTKVFKRRVPNQPWYLGDGMALTVLLGVQILTGVALAFTYTPAVDHAHDSVRFLSERQTFGWFVRGLHYWSGGLMVVMIVLHVFRQVILGGYKSPREGIWLIGVVLLILVISTSFLGYVLRWDDRGMAGLKVALTIFERIPLVGDGLVRLVQGGPDLSTITLTRLYAMHVIFIPILIMALVAYHLYLIILLGTTAPAEHGEHVDTGAEQKQVYKEQAESPTEGEVFFPTAVIKIAPWSVVALGMALILTLTNGAPALGPPANQQATSHPREEWWFAWYSALTALMPAAYAPTFHILFPIVLFGGLVLLPFADRGPARGWRHRPIATTIVVILATALIGLSSWRLRSPFGGEASSAPPPIPRGIVLAEDARQGHQLFGRFGCVSCHPIAGAGKEKIGTDLARLERIYSQEELRSYILAPPAGVAMPSYAGRLTDEEMQQLTAFVMVVQTFPRTQGD